MKERRERYGHNNMHRSTMKIYGSPPSRKSQTRKARPTSHESRDSGIPSIIGAYEERKNSLPDVNPLLKHETNPIRNDSCELDSAQQREAKTLARLNRVKDKLRGKYLRFDIPNGLDDTTSRFIMAVTLRYKFEVPDESSVHGNFDSSVTMKDHELKCRKYAEPLIQMLNARGLVFVRQLLPVDNMIEILSSMQVTEDFIVLSCSLLNVLLMMTNGQYFNRKYLMARCRDLKALTTKTASDEGSNEHLNLVTFLGECGSAGAGCDDLQDDDNPGGLWQSRKGSKGAVDYETQPRSSNKQRTRNRSWVIPYTEKIISKSESRNPALSSYRKGRLLDRNRLG